MKTNSLLSDFLLAAHPVGSYYWSKESTNPSQIFGGTWEQVKDRFVLAAGDSYTEGNTGGESEHTLTVDEMPTHSHDILWHSRTSFKPTDIIRNVANTSEYGGWVKDYARIGNTENDNGGNISVGGGQPHNNMPPYIVAYCFVRVA